MLRLAPRAVEAPQECSGPRFVLDLSKLAYPVREQVAAPLRPLRPILSQQPAGPGGGRLGGHPDSDFSREAGEAPVTKAGVGHVRDRLLPTGMAVVVVQPDPVHVESLQHPAKRAHPILAIAGM